MISTFIWLNVCPLCWKLCFNVLVMVAIISESDPWKTSIKATLQGEKWLSVVAMYSCCRRTWGVKGLRGGLNKGHSVFQNLLQTDKNNGRCLLKWNVKARLPVLVCPVWSDWYNVSVCLFSDLNCFLFWHIIQFFFNSLLEKLTLSLLVPPSRLQF